MKESALPSFVNVLSSESELRRRFDIELDTERLGFLLNREGVPDEYLPNWGVILGDKPRVRAAKRNLWKASDGQAKPIGLFVKEAKLGAEQIEADDLQRILNFDLLRSTMLTLDLSSFHFANSVRNSLVRRTMAMSLFGTLLLPSHEGQVDLLGTLTPILALVVGAGMIAATQLGVKEYERVTGFAREKSDHSYWNSMVDVRVRPVGA